MSDDTFDNVLKWTLITIVGAFAVLLVLAVVTVLCAVIALVVSEVTS